MKGYKENVEMAVLQNTNFRKVLYTGAHSQLVAMSIESDSEIGMETHKDTDQFFRFEKGTGKVFIDENEYLISDGDAVIVPAGAKHNIINTSSSEPLKLYTVYSPAHHKDGVVYATKAEADAAVEEFDGVTTE
jgi:mannose-6-phosphate isomerase-like protein (cupin superfamily)